MTGALVARAEQLAVAAHGDQQYGTQPYTVHLAAVVDVLREFGVHEPVVLAAGWLHDAIEDTALTAELITERLDHLDVATIVEAVTDGEGRNRRERKEAVYRAIQAVPFAVLVKLADRIANVRAAVGSVTQSDRQFVAMYRKEQAVFEDRLDHAPGGGTRAEAMRAELRRLLA